MTWHVEELDTGGDDVGAFSLSKAIFSYGFACLQPNTWRLVVGVSGDVWGCPEVWGGVQGAQGEGCVHKVGGCVYKVEDACIAAAHLVPCIAHSKLF